MLAAPRTASQLALGAPLLTGQGRAANRTSVTVPRGGSRRLRAAALVSGVALMASSMHASITKHPALKRPSRPLAQ